MTTFPSMAGFHLPRRGRFCPPGDSRAVRYRREDLEAYLVARAVEPVYGQQTPPTGGAA